MNWNIFLYVLLGVLLLAALVVAVIIFVKTGMKDYLIQLIGEAENLYPKTEPDYQKKRLQYVLENFKAKYKWLGWLINAAKFIAKFCKKYVITAK